MTWSAIVGTIAALCTTLAFWPQLLKVRRQGGAGLSWSMLSMYLAGQFLWLGYGVMNDARAVIAANLASIALVSAIVVHEGPRQSPAGPPPAAHRDRHGRGDGGRAGRARAPVQSRVRRAADDRGPARPVRSRRTCRPRIERPTEALLDASFFRGPGRHGRLSGRDPRSRRPARRVHRDRRHGRAGVVRREVSSGSGSTSRSSRRPASSSAATRASSTPTISSTTDRGTSPRSRGGRCCSRRRTTPPRPGIRGSGPGRRFASCSRRSIAPSTTSTARRNPPAGCSRANEACRGGSAHSPTAPSSRVKIASYRLSRRAS